MQDEKHAKDEKAPEVKAGYLVLRIRQGEGVVISDVVEVRLSSIKKMTEAQLAIRAPKTVSIRKVR